MFNSRLEPRAFGISAFFSITTLPGPRHFLNDVLEEALRGGLFKRLSFERQVALCQFLLDTGGVAEAVNTVLVIHARGLTLA